MKNLIPHLLLSQIKLDSNIAKMVYTLTGSVSDDNGKVGVTRRRKAEGPKFRIAWLPNQELKRVLGLSYLSNRIGFFMGDKE